MVGHTGDIEATVVACKAADEAVKVRTNKTTNLCHVTLSVFCFHYLYILEAEQLHDGK